MCKPRSPSTLYDAALKFAQEQFDSRKAELKAMRGSLDLLEQFMPALAERGFRLHVDHMRWARLGRKVSLFMSDTKATPRLYHAFKELGFTESARQDYSSFFHVDLKKGRLTVHMTVWEEKAAA